MDGLATVSVIIPVWNAERYLRECLDSVVGQSIGLDRLEVIAVDDGSTDGSTAVLDDYAARHPQISVIREPNSGGPGRPRNVGLDHATGTYVFFLDADDYLGREALERVVAMAERNSSDIVLGKMVGVGGRRVPMRAFHKNLDRARVDQVYSSLSALKLFRRALIERLGLRFAEGVAGHEDGPFTAQAYLESDGISVVADYACYYARASSRSRPVVDLLDYLEGIALRVETLARHREAGAGRDRLMARHIDDVVRAFSPRWLALEPEERRRVYEAGSNLIKRWHTDRIQRTFAPQDAIRAHCLGHGLATELEDIVGCPPSTVFGDPVVEGHRVFARYPHFRDASGIPDSCFEITDLIAPRQRVTRLVVAGSTLSLSGEAFLKYLGGSTTILLRRRPWGSEYRFPTEAVATPDLKDRNTPYPDAGFTVAIDLATAADGRPLAPGTWDVLMSIATSRVRRTSPVRPPNGADTASWVVQDVRRSDPRVSLRVPKAGDPRLSVKPVTRLSRWLERGEQVYARLRRQPRRAR